IALLPNPIGTVAENDPSAPATVDATDDAPLVASTEDTVTFARGAVVPVTVVDVAASVLPFAGAVIVTPSAPGGPCATYRRAVNCGVSWFRPVARARISRSSCACAQVSGEADPAAFPSVKPMDAVARSLPNGDASRSGFSHACSGTRPTPEEKFSIAVSRGAALLRLPAATSDSARSPDSTGHRCPVPRPVGAHGAPAGEHLVWPGWAPAPSAVPGAAELRYG